MEVTDAIRTRRSIRKFLEIPIEWEKVAMVLDSGRLAPSAGNVQDWKFIVVVDPDTRADLAIACAGQTWMSNAPVHIVVCAEPVKSNRFYGERGEKVFSIMNAAACIQNMLLTAHSNGLGACWVSAFDEERVKTKLGIPPEARVSAVIPIGYPDEKPPEPLKFGLEVSTYFDGWGIRFKDIISVKEEYDVKTQKALKRMKGMFEKIKNAIKR